MNKIVLINQFVTAFSVLFALDNFFNIKHQDILKFNSENANWRSSILKNANFDLFRYLRKKDQESFKSRLDTPESDRRGRDRIFLTTFLF